MRTVEHAADEIDGESFEQLPSSVREALRRTVTLLGDAVHSMPPTGGIGANTALRDAQLLTSNLARAVAGDWRLLDAVAEYEAQMRDYGFAVQGLWT
jgi:2-polyprenyl-6-methoxyphenol hydroxylase-like FAD-dependent oxidoreductase